MKTLNLAAMITVSLGACVACAAQPGGSQYSAGLAPPGQSAGGSVYQPDVPANPHETAHDIGGESFYYGPHVHICNGGDGAG